MPRQKPANPKPPSQAKVLDMLREVSANVSVREFVPHYVDAEPSEFVWKEHVEPHDRANKSVVTAHATTWNDHRLVVKRVRPEASEDTPIYLRHVQYHGYCDGKLVLRDVSKIRARARLEIYAFKIHHGLKKLD